MNNTYFEHATYIILFVSGEFCITSQYKIGEEQLVTSTTQNKNTILFLRLLKQKCEMLGSLTLLLLLLELQTPSSTVKTTTTALTVSTFPAYGLGFISDVFPETKIPPDKYNNKTIVPKLRVVHFPVLFTFEINNNTY